MRSAKRMLCPKSSSSACSKPKYGPYQSSGTDADPSTDSTLPVGKRGYVDAKCALPMIAVACPARAKCVATEFGSASSGRSIPLDVTPCVDGYCPVRIVARDGWQYGFCVRQRVNAVPVATSL